MKYAHFLKTVFTALLFSGGSHLLAQEPSLVRQPDGTYKIADLNTGVVGAGRTVITASGDAKYTLWLETGDGNYVSDFSTFSAFRPTGTYDGFMLASILYDNRKRPPTTASLAAKTGTGSVATMVSPMLMQDQKIKLFANVNDIIPNEKMVFAISIRLTDANPYKLVFRYNTPTATSFREITSETAATVFTDKNGNTLTAVPDIRFYDGAQVSRLVSGNADLQNFANGISFTRSKNVAGIKNFFITLSTPGEIPAGTTVEAELFTTSVDRQGSWNSAGISRIESMPGLGSHDPNNLVVSPACLPLPQQQSTLHYRLNFQNLGAGPAKAVTAFFYPPAALGNNPALTNMHAAFSDMASFPVSSSYDALNRRFIFRFEPSGGELLEGTSGLPNALTNPKTMGYVEFDATVKPGADPSLPFDLYAWAEIYFLSQTPDAVSLKVSQAAIDGGHCPPDMLNWEWPVRTNNAVARFGYCAPCGDSGKCACDNPKNLQQWLKCYWWLIVIALLLILLLWSLLKRRRP